MEFIKQKNNGGLDQDQQDKINNSVERVKGIFRKSSANKEEIDVTAVTNKGKMSNHELEAKIMRRKMDLDEIERVCDENLESIIVLKERVDEEIESC